MVGTAMREEQLSIVRTDPFMGANLKDGLLEIQIAKREESLPKSIEVRGEQVK